MAVDFDGLLNAAIVATFQADEPATFEPVGQPPFLLVGIFNRDHVAVALDADGSTVTARATTFFARLADFPAGTEPLQGDFLTVEGTEYHVADVQPDAIGGVLLVLSARLIVP